MTQADATGRPLLAAWARPCKSWAVTHNRSVKHPTGGAVASVFWSGARPRPRTHAVRGTLRKDACWSGWKSHATLRSPWWGGRTRQHSTTGGNYSGSGCLGVRITSTPASIGLPICGCKRIVRVSPISIPANVCSLGWLTGRPAPRWTDCNTRCP